MKRLPTLLVALFFAAFVVAGCASGDAESSEASSGSSAGATASTASASVENGALPEITVYKSATCNCCKDWVSHLRENDFDVKTLDTPAMKDVKDRLNVPGELRSCHTAYVDGEVLEGHVPASVIKQYLQNDASKALGLAVPGMPVGSPGMEVEGRAPQPYEVMAFRANGQAGVYSRQQQ